MAEKIEWFYLDWTKYEFEWWWASYTAWNWIDITDDEIWLDGTYEKIDYSAMQWPAPSGYHVSLKSEWQAVYGILITTFWLTANATTIGTYLKMPMAGYRHAMDASVQSLHQGSYWTSTPSGSDSACEFSFHSSNIYYDYTTKRAYGFTIRCFKDSPVVPTSSWTTLYDWSSVATGAWVFWNSTDGLISVSGDWQTWYTIMDKNLWATTVYNQGDSATANNCGNFYQWWNNYWFPRPSSMTPDITKSSTKVDASTYWPWNYYNSSTFITVNASPYDRSSVHNDNLWGGVTWVQAASWKLVVWDKLYKIVTSTTAPASWTASNIITIVTD